MYNESKKGFTLIELLIVVVIIGILAAIAIPKFAQTRERAYVSSMKADLRNLATEQEIWYSDPANPALTYSADPAGDFNFTTSDGVNLGTVTGTGTGWSGIVTHDGTGIACDIYYGDATATTNAVAPGVVGCSAS
ncbi:MAG TPA: prepilin-type N-terminal cleavage/methylation domain-containing protein [Longimicrobiales bacterium]|nr:prepilin-type N-terminal cleavage/methylation domain-containing protein [Longimicrobiales bacterium]